MIINHHSTLSTEEVRSLQTPNRLVFLPHACCYSVGKRCSLTVSMMPRRNWGHSSSWVEGRLSHAPSQHLIGFSPASAVLASPPHKTQVKAWHSNCHRSQDPVSNALMPGMIFTMESFPACSIVEELRIPICSHMLCSHCAPWFPAGCRKSQVLALESSRLKKPLWSKNKNFSETPQAV